MVIDLQHPAEFAVEKKGHELTVSFAKPEACARGFRGSSEPCSGKHA